MPSTRLLILGVVCSPEQSHYRNTKAWYTDSSHRIQKMYTSLRGKLIEHLLSKNSTRLTVLAHNTTRMSRDIRNPEASAPPKSVRLLSVRKHYTDTEQLLHPRDPAGRHKPGSETQAGRHQRVFQDGGSRLAVPPLIARYAGSAAANLAWWPPLLTFYCRPTLGTVLHWLNGIMKVTEEGNRFKDNRSK
ncbi:hypothetical protein J6590_027610 [Homalodisca vitripennis]|nr:hypothetical protein J6590_027610 [Homalodisca vitripennis]